MKVLIAEDEPISRRVLAATITGWGYEVIAVADGKEALQTLMAEGAPQLAILNWKMPGMDGIDVVSAIRRQKAEPYLYVILLTAKEMPDDLIVALDSGADDYMSKSLNNAELKARLQAGRRICELQEKLINAREELHIRATHDALTGSWNRQAIMEMLEIELARAARTKSNIAVMMADIDHFKGVNDTWGHQAGDLVLKEVVARITARLRPYDACGRYGGEEFIVVLPGCDRDQGALIAEKLRQGVCAEAVAVTSGAIPVTISFGVAAADGAEPADLHALVNRADMALYRAKKNGRNRVEVG